MNIHHIRVGRIVFGLLGLSSIVIEIVALINEEVFNPANFFSFFTILSNIFAGVFLVYYGVTNNQAYKVQAVRGAATLYMLMTGVIFAVLLAGIDGIRLTAVPWDNIVLHYIMPVVMVADWLIYPPKTTLSIRTTLTWIAFPLLYVIYTLIRGSFAFWYPYPFLNPLISSYTQVIVTSLILSIFVIAASFGLRLYVNKMHARVSHE